MVVYKPAGLAAQSAKSFEKDLVSELKTYLKGGGVFLVHRLDQPVEGLLVVAKTKAAAAGLTSQLAGGSLNKDYLAVVQGRPEPEGILEDFLKKEGPTAVVTDASDPEGKQSRLTYHVLGTKTVEGGEASLVRVHIDTGRFHQIRAQFAHAGYPLLGDRKYGSQESSTLSGKLGVGTVALCADRIRFLHPVTKKEISYVTEPEESIFQNFKEYSDHR
jgi:23S rRNA pseudouridine1911/1915/1917 synthase